MWAECMRDERARRIEGVCAGGLRECFAGSKLEISS